MKQVARNVTDSCDGFLAGKRFLIIDRDTKYCSDFVALIEGAGTKVVRLPARSPNLNAHAERFVRTTKDECTRRLLLFGEHSVQRSVATLVDHYNRQRFHQGMGNELLTPVPKVRAGPIVCSERLGGRLKYYARQAA